MRATTLAETARGDHAGRAGALESWPLWAIGLEWPKHRALVCTPMVRIKAAELNIIAPALLNTALPLADLAGAIAAALSLDGVLIAAIAGARHGRCRHRVTMGHDCRRWRIFGRDRLHGACWASQRCAGAPYCPSPGAGAL